MPTQDVISRDNVSVKVNAVIYFRVVDPERLNLDIQQVLDAQTDAWGIKVANVEIKHVDLDESMVRARARRNASGGQR